MLQKIATKILFSLILITFSYTCVNANEISKQAKVEERILCSSQVVAPLPKIYSYQKKEIVSDIQTTQVTVASKSQETIFTESTNTALPILQSNKAVLFYLFTSVLTIIALVRSFFSGYLLSIQESLFNNNLSKQHYRGQKTGWLKATVLTTFFNILTLSTLFYLVAYNFSVIHLIKPLPLFLLIFGIISLYHGFKFLTNGLLAKIFNFRNSIGLYNYNFFVTEVAVCVVIMPLLVLATFNSLINIEIILTLALLFVMAGLIFAALKGIRSTFNLILPNKFYFFLYFCILEIGPFVFAYKAINNWLIIG